jgi:hypothetical protein
MKGALALEKRKTVPSPADEVAKETRRDVLKAVFVAPVILSLPAAAAFAEDGSGRSGRRRRPIRWGRDD